MNDDANLNLPVTLAELESDAEASGFQLSSERLTGSLLRTLAASKPGGHFLEIGTGIGAGSCWLLDGMDSSASLISVERDANNTAIADRHLGLDERVTFIVMDAEVFLKQADERSFDLIFADAFPGKFVALDECLALLKPGGLYIIDDLVPQATWPENHAPKVENLIATLQARSDLKLTSLDWASGLIVATKIGL